MIDILLVNENHFMCNLISSVFDDEQDIRVIGSATNLEQTLNIISRLNVDILLTSAHLPGNLTLELVKKVRTVAPEVNILILGISESREQVLPFVEAGAVGYITKEGTIEELVSIIREAHQGKAVISSEITAEVISRLTRYARIFAGIEVGIIDEAGLTSRELQVLELLGQKMTNQEIAEQLFIEVGTVKNHVHNILTKLNVNTRKEASSFVALIEKKPTKTL